MKSFQDLNNLKNVYSQKNLIEFRGKFLRTHSLSEKSIRDYVEDELLFPEKNLHIDFTSKLNTQTPRNKKILDIGCGNCSFLKKINIKYPGNDLYALDIKENSECFDININYNIYDGKNFPKYEYKFDYILLMHMLYHVPDFFPLFKFIKSSAHEKTKTIITTKSKFTLPKMEQIYREVVSNTDMELTDRDERHFCLENGKEILRQHFDISEYTIRKNVLSTAIKVDSVDDVLKYVFSTQRYKPSAQPMKEDEYIEKWMHALNKEIAYRDTYTEVIFIIERQA